MEGLDQIQQRYEEVNNDLIKHGKLPELLKERMELETTMENEVKQEETELKSRLGVVNSKLSHLLETDATYPDVLGEKVVIEHELKNLGEKLAFLKLEWSEESWTSFTNQDENGEIVTELERPTATEYLAQQNVTTKPGEKPWRFPTTKELLLAGKYKASAFQNASFFTGENPGKNENNFDSCRAVWVPSGEIEELQAFAKVKLVR